MQVKRDFEDVYRTEAEPWNIGRADSPRYDLYHDVIAIAARARSSILDIGCGFGAFLARFRDDFDTLVGVDVSRHAVEEGARRHPFIEYLHAPASELSTTPLEAQQFDAIVCSDLIYYLPESDRVALLRWIARHVSADGLAFIAAWCPSGDYLSADELHRLVVAEFAVEEARRLETGHALFLGRRKRFLVALTLDYETWQPVPEGRQIDWETDVLSPTARLLDICDRHTAPLTIMAEMGEYFWLREKRPELAARMEDQWREAVGRGHDVQVHLHPNWLPELGAREDHGAWWWDPAYATIADYPDDVTGLVRRCRAALETILRPVEPRYRVRCFRAGGYEAQPFTRLHDALLASGINCDTSVYPGHRHDARHYDYSLAYSNQQPYFASRVDPQLRAPEGEHGLIELPAFVHEPGIYWTFDSTFGSRFPELLHNYIATKRNARRSTETYRRVTRLRGLARGVYVAWQRRLKVVNWLLPRRLTHLLVEYPTEVLVQHEYFVLVGHSKMDLELDEIDRALERLSADQRIEFVSLSTMEQIARGDLERPPPKPGRDVPPGSAARAAMWDLIPLDSSEVLQLVPDGAPVRSPELTDGYPWLDVTTRFVRAGAAELDSAEAVDCICCDHALEQLAHPDKTLATAYQVLRWGGALIAAVRSDARNARRSEPRHLWKTAPHDVAARLAAAGFVDVEIEERDEYRRPGTMPYPPSNDRTIYVRAWKRQASGAQLQRLDTLCRWTYGRLSPERPVVADAATILARGVGWCLDYVVVLGEALKREGFDVRWVTMLAVDHPRGRGKQRADTHEVLEVTLRDGTRHVVDPMAGVRFPSSLAELLRTPELADIERARDERYRERDYDLYATSFWYQRVRKVDVRKSPRDPSRLVPARRITKPTRLSELLWAPRSRPLRRLVRGALARAQSGISSKSAL